MTQASKTSRRPDPQPKDAPNSLPDELRRKDAPRIPSDEIPTPDSGDGLVPAGGGLTPTEDGGNKNHPIHDDDPSEDATPGDYEWEIRRLDAAAQRD